MEYEQQTFTDTLILQVWDKGTQVQGYDPNMWRQDFAGAWIRKDLYGTNHNYGWEINHLIPTSKGGSDNLDNLYPLNWKNNETKDENYPKIQTSVSSVVNHNVDKKQQWRIKDKN